MAGSILGHCGALPPDRLPSAIGAYYPGESENLSPREYCEAPLADVRPFSIPDLDRRDVVMSRSRIRDNCRDYDRLKAEAERRDVPLRIVSDGEFDEMVGNDP